MKTKNLFLLPALIAGVGLILAGGVTAQTFTIVHSFVNSDGVNPEAELILSGSTLYGTAESGGSSGAGTVFAVNTDDTGFTTLQTDLAPKLSAAERRTARRADPGFDSIRQGARASRQTARSHILTERHHSAICSGPPRRQSSVAEPTPDADHKRLCPSPAYPPSRKLTLHDEGKFSSSSR